MKNLNPEAIAAIASQYGTKPVNIVSIQWGNQYVDYADRQIYNVPGQIINVSEIDSVINVSGGTDSQSVQVVLSDHKGDLKNIIDTLDPHMRPVKVYQWFDGMSSLDERFLLFKGQINSPVVWNERDRTLSLTIISQIESAEVGFSIEEGKFVNPAEDLIGKPWPLVFGTCINVPALRLTTPYRGVLGQGFGIADPTLDLKIQAAENLLCPKVWEQVWVPTGPTNPTKAITDYPHYRAYFFETVQPGALQVRVYGEAIGGAIPEIRYNPPAVQINGVTIFDGVEFNCSAPAGSKGTAENPQAGVVTVSLDKPFNKKVNRADRFEWYQGATSPPSGGTDAGGYYKNVSSTTPECRNEKCRLIEDLKFQKEQQIAVQRDSVIILNGKNFPQGTNLILNINEALLEGRFEGTQDEPSNLFRIVRMQHPDYAEYGLLTYTQLQAQILQNDLDQQLIGSECTGSGGQPADLGAIYEKYQECLTDAGEDEIALTQCKNTFDNSYYKWKFNGSENAKAEYTREVYNAIPQSEFFWASPGAEVKGLYDIEVVYLVNLLPSEVIRVSAYRTLGTTRQLLTVPSDYYTVRTVDYTSYVATEIVFESALSARREGWEDEVFVNLQSSVGPNTVDIMEWLIETYTSFDVDSVTFDDVKIKLANYPSNFPILTRPNILELLQDIAFQCRCSLTLRDDKFYLRYLSEAPTGVAEITENDVNAGSLTLEHTRTEDIVTKFVARWRKDYVVEEANTLILRHNVSKYGSHEAEYDFFIYNILDYVRKSATFWLIRKANTWRRAQFTTPLQHMAIETFDTVDVTLPDIVNGTVVAEVESAKYDSAAQEMKFSVWLPVLAGTRNAYDFAYPASISEELKFPTDADIIEGLAGSGGEAPGFLTIAPPGHPLDNEGSTVYPPLYTPGTPINEEPESFPPPDDPGPIGGIGVGNPPQSNNPTQYQYNPCIRTPDGGPSAFSDREPCRSDHGDPYPSDEGDPYLEPDAYDDDGMVNTSKSEAELKALGAQGTAFDGGGGGGGGGGGSPTVPPGGTTPTIPPVPPGAPGGGDVGASDGVDGSDGGEGGGGGGPGGGEWPPPADPTDSFEDLPDADSYEPPEGSGCHTTVIINWFDTTWNGSTGPGSACIPTPMQQEKFVFSGDMTSFDQDTPIPQPPTCGRFVQTQVVSGLSGICNGDETGEVVAYSHPQGSLPSYFSPSWSE